MALVGPGVHGLVHRWVTGRPTAAAVSDPSTGAVLDYAGLWERAGWVAALLAERGIGAGDVVAVGIGRSVDLVVALLGVLRSGAAYLPLDTHAPAGRVATVLADSGARLVLTPENGPSAVRLPVGVACAPLPSVPVTSDLTCAETGGDRPCYVMYTSGSTGTPKGVVVPHRAVVRLVTRAHYCVVGPGDRCANGANPAFDATTFEIWGALVAGGEVVVLPSVLELTIDDWAAVVRREGVHTMFLTTSLFHTVARERPDAFDGVSNLVVGGEQLDLGAARRVLESGAPPRRLVNGYGPTETTTFAAAFDCTLESLAAVERVPVGFPLQDTALHVLDEDLAPVAPGESGELCVGGPGVALGYLGLPELTERRFVRDPATGARLYRTGDLARLLPSGALEVLGRRDRQVKLRGFRIELDEVEQAVMATGMCDTAVVERVGEGAEALLAGFVLPAGVAEEGFTEALVANLRQRLPGYMVPARWVVLGELAYGSTGKLDRAGLLALLDAPATSADEDLGPDGEVSREIWREVLGVPRVAAGDGFLDLGGNSISAVQVATRLRQRGVPVEPADVLLADSLGAFARALPAGVTAL
ncbi:non-ribosomal peptide synthetase [Actinokineospora sp. NBRC 105648]|uniref:non-ribosomal peptide synthetase n=1 Tax=Actinokineospora sp. NBRC 105648 TaxID=3032206 RepID=UPI0024A4264C|nr:non-ribosomal peptide synthetase [Actinokineospora sp. NBRC 105648]GLZ39703.1 amino acid adenylation protein [Actinokineospora sp. NBRC 105648]